MPASAAPALVELKAGSVEVTLSTDVDRLTPTAVTQIVCTVLDRQQGVARTVLLLGGGHTLDGLTCAR